MDQRETFDSAESLKKILTNIYHQQQMASLLIDINGLERVEGYITQVEDGSEAAKTIVAINNRQLMLHQIIAVNGIFHAAYSEC
jgi:hypothetical protein